MFEKVREVIAETLGCNKDRIREDSLLVEDLHIDSLDALEILSTLGTDFDISDLDEDFSRFKTVKDVVVYLENHTSSKE